MNRPRISIIVALSENRVIGRDNRLPWHIPDDLKRFKRLTTGHAIIMGRKTYESIGRPLPQRTNIIITRDKTFSVEGCVVVHSLDEAVRFAQKLEGPEGEIFIIGGGQIFEQALPLVDRLYLTVVRGTHEGDVFFPDYSAFKTVVTDEPGSSGGVEYRLLTLERS